MQLTDKPVKQYLFVNAEVYTGSILPFTISQSIFRKPIKIFAFCKKLFLKNVIDSICYQNCVILRGNKPRCG